MQHLGWRILICVAWLAVALTLILGVVVPSINIEYKGNLYFDSQQDYNTFKKDIANSEYTIIKLDVINNGGELVVFDVQVPKSMEFGYGKGFDPTVIYIILISFIAIGSAILTAFTW